MSRRAASLIMQHTVSSRAHLTPELALRLITPACPLWTAKGDELPFPDPFWGFYWPGGQATARYILDNPKIVENRTVLDLGCGCGAGAIAAAKMKAKRVLANDIDPYALEATAINASLNAVSVETSGSDLVGAGAARCDTLLVGDMFYDAEFADSLFSWLMTLRGTTVLIGDPGRAGLARARRGGRGGRGWRGWLAWRRTACRRTAVWRTGASPTPRCGGSILNKPQSLIPIQCIFILMSLRQSKLTQNSDLL